VGKTKGERQLGRPRLKCENDIKMNIKEMGWGGIEWINLARNGAQCLAVVNRAMKIRIPKGWG
jgi:hypothetical protein